MPGRGMAVSRTVKRRDSELHPISKGAPATAPSGEIPRDRFPRTSRLLKHSEFQRVYESGQRHFSGLMTVFYLRRPRDDRGGARVGFTVSRALGGAVQRNHIRRRMREAVRRELHRLNVPVDVVINPKRVVLEAEFANLTAEIARAFDVVRRKLGSATQALDSETT